MELPRAFGDKAPGAGRDWPWKRVFPATRTYFHQASGQRRRHHLTLQATADTLVSEMIWTAVFKPPMGSVESLLTGGDMGVLENPVLAAELTSWVARVEHLNELETIGVDHYYRDFEPYLRDAGITIADLRWSRRDLYPSYPIEPRRTRAYLLLDDVG